MILLDMGFGEDPGEDKEDKKDSGGDIHPYLRADVYKEGCAAIKSMDIRNVQRQTKERQA